MVEKYPELKERIQSSFIDGILIIIMMFVFAAILDRFENAPDWVRVVVFAGLFVIYEPVCIVFGCTLGNYLKGIRVRKNSDSTKRINIFQSLLRYPVKIFLGWVSFLTIGTNAKRRAIHDIVADTVMIKL
jgi:uncharacterized RDD family membrane protein YckC